MEPLKNVMLGPQGKTKAEVKAKISFSVGTTSTAMAYFVDKFPQVSGYFLLRLPCWSRHDCTEGVCNQFEHLGRAHAGMTQTYTL